MKVKLIKDIIIPLGTILDRAAVKVERVGDFHVETQIGLSKDSSGTFTYFIEPMDDLSEYFEVVE